MVKAGKWVLVGIGDVDLGSWVIFGIFLVDQFLVYMFFVHSRFGVKARQVGPVLLGLPILWPEYGIVI